MSLSRISSEKLIRARKKLMLAGLPEQLGPSSVPIVWTNRNRDGRVHGLKMAMKLFKSMDGQILVPIFGSECGIHGKRDGEKARVVLQAKANHAREWSVAKDNCIHERCFSPQYLCGTAKNRAN